MTTMRQFDLPPDRQRQMRKATGLEWLSIAYLGSVIVLMYLVMGSSQAMKSAWIEDMLSLIPPIGFLIASRVRHRRPDRQYPYGYYRAVNVAYFISALALFAMGLFLLIDGSLALIHAEHPTIGAVELFGRTLWLGWLMIAVLVWATLPAIVLGRAKARMAKALHDKPLFADAEMNKADWLTGVAAAAGVMGIGLGWWWADAVAAIVISIDVLADGVRNLRAVVGDLMDRAPKTVDQRRYLDLPARMEARIQALDWVRSTSVRLREQGHVLCGDVFTIPADDHDMLRRRDEVIAAVADLDWRLHEVTVQFVRSLAASDDQDAATHTTADAP